MGYTPHVLVVGGGPLGAGLARDLSIRGLDVTLATPGPLVTSRVGRMGGLLASGAQFACEDPEYARRCLAERRTLSEIAGHCVEDTGGLVVGEALDELQAACERCSITAERLDGATAREREPGLAATVEGALAVPDAAIDPHLLTVATARDAREYGADIHTRARVTDIEVVDGTVETATLSHDPAPTEPDHTDEASHARVRPDDGQGMGLSGSNMDGLNRSEETPTPTTEELDVDYIVNAAGREAPAVADRAGCSVPVPPRQVTTLVAGGRPVEMAVTRPADSDTTPDTAVPVGQHTLLATEGPPDEADGVAPSSVDAARDSLSTLVDGAQPLRAFGMHRDHLDVGEGRDFGVLDHDSQGCWGLLTVFGGTVTTHRRVAERVCDKVCGEFGIRRACQTDELLVPGSEDVPDLAQAVGTFGLAESVYEHSKRRLGGQANAVLHTEGENPVLCHTQSVTRTEVSAALDDSTGAAADLGGVRVRTSAATGDCQGGRCAHRLATQLYPTHDTDVVETACAALLEERWAGQRPVVDARSTELARTHRDHAATMNRDHQHNLGHEDIAAFDSGFGATTERPRCCPRVGWEP
jgi:Glycerol-3-phosphate dehydrogenase